MVIMDWSIIREWGGGGAGVSVSIPLLPLLPKKNNNNNPVTGHCLLPAENKLVASRGYTTK